MTQVQDPRNPFILKKVRAETIEDVIIIMDEIISGLAGEQFSDLTKRETHLMREVRIPPDED